MREEERSVPPSYDLEREIVDLSVAERVKGAIRRLSEGERRAIELAYLGGHSYREVASMLDEPEGTVKSRIRAGLRKLHGELADLVVSDVVRGAET
jgi:RNA polymerase sigma-70 factor (ECF subfamily)